MVNFILGIFYNKQNFKNSNIYIFLCLLPKQHVTIFAFPHSCQLWPTWRWACHTPLQERTHCPALRGMVTWESPVVGSAAVHLSFSAKVPLSPANYWAMRWFKVWGRTPLIGNLCSGAPRWASCNFVRLASWSDSFQSCPILLPPFFFHRCYCPINLHF